MRFTRPAAYTAAHRVIAACILCLGITAAAYGALQVTLGSRPAYIHVRWAPDVDDAIRRESERRHGLA